MNYKDIIKTAPVTTVSVGTQGMALFPADTLAQEQVGYSVDPQGTDLTGEADGDWRKEWIVIGHDTMLADPIFIDSSSAEYPVFTAMHGAGDWNPTPISPTLDSFIRSLAVLRDLQPAFLAFSETGDRTPLDRAVSDGRIRLAEINRKIGEDYWTTFFSILDESIEEE